LAAPARAFTLRPAMTRLRATVEAKDEHAAVLTGVLEASLERDARPVKTRPRSRPPSGDGSAADSPTIRPVLSANRRHPRDEPPGRRRQE